MAGCLLTGTRPIHTEVEGVAVLGTILAACGAARERRVAEVICA
ncbi:hypothetical protein [Streptomyces sp. NP160]|nr:hypothetical protein [Streptomyces sp. NP160]